MKRLPFYLSLVWLLSAYLTNAQSFGIGTDVVDPQAILELQSTNQGFLAPRMTTTQRNAIAVANGQDEGLMIYNLSTDQFNYWDGAQWIAMPDDDWTRNSGAMYPSNIGDNVGIGTTNPLDRLVVAGGRVEFLATTDASGTTGSGVLEIANSLRLDGNEIITNTNTELLMQFGNNGNLSIDDNTFFVDASANNVGIGTTAPSDKLTVVGGRVEITATGDANGTAGTGVLEIGNSLRLDGNEIITNTNTLLYINSDNNGDVLMDNNTFRLDASTNRIGIGTSLPTARLDIRSQSNNDEILALPGGRTLFWDFDDNSDRYGLNVSDDSPDALYLYSQEGNFEQAYLWADGASANDAIFGISSRPTGGTWTSKFIVDQQGDVGIGTNFPAFDLQVGQNSAAKPGSSSWTVFSDESLKSDISPYKEGLSELMKIQPIWYTYNGKFDLPKERFVGTTAQELEEVFPHMISKVLMMDKTGHEEEISTIDYHAMTFVLINAIKELNEKIETQADDYDKLYSMIENCGCDKDVYFDDTDGLDDIKLFPNPATNKINVTGATKYKSYSIINMSGQVVQLGKFDEQINIHNLSSGSYFLILNGPKGDKMIQWTKQ